MNVVDLPAPDGGKFCLYQWPVYSECKVAVHIIHGMCDHAQRYDHLAKYLAEKGIAVSAHDQPGHGQNIERHGHVQGFFEEFYGWDHAVKTAIAAIRHSKIKFPGAKMVLMGHSMGSFVAQQIALDYGKEIDGLILSASDSQAGPQVLFAEMLGSVMGKFKGGRYPSKTYDKIIAGRFNSRIKNKASKFDWLSRDPQVVRKYLQDPLAGFIPTIGLWSDIAHGLRQISKPGLKHAVPSDLPIVLYAGSEDPVGGYGKRVEKLAKEYHQAGVKDLSLKIYPGGRHEMHNETNRDEVLNDIYSWIAQRFIK